MFSEGPVNSTPKPAFDTSPVVQPHALKVVMGLSRMAIGLARLLPRVSMLAVFVFALHTKLTAERILGRIILHDDKYIVSITQPTGIYDFLLGPHQKMQLSIAEGPMHLRLHLQGGGSKDVRSLLAVIENVPKETESLLLPRHQLSTAEVAAIVRSQQSHIRIVTSDGKPVQIFPPHPGHPSPPQFAVCTNATEYCFSIGPVSADYIEFTPPVDITVNADSPEKPPTYKVSKISFEMGPNAKSLSQALGVAKLPRQLFIEMKNIEINPARVDLSRSSGWQEDESFLFSTVGPPLKRPSIGDKKITWIANSAHSPMRMALDASGNDGKVQSVIWMSNTDIGAPDQHFECNDFEIDDFHLLRLTPIVSTPSIQIRVNPWKPWTREYPQRDVDLTVSFDDLDEYVYDMRIRSDSDQLGLLDSRLISLPTEASKASGALVARLRSNYRLSMPERTADRDERESITAADLSLEQRKTLKGIDSLRLPMVVSSEPIHLKLRITPLNDDPLGLYESHLVLQGINSETQVVSIKYNLVDPWLDAKQAFLGILSALVASFLGWVLLDRGRKKREAREKQKHVRETFVKTRFLRLRELRSRLNTLSKEHESIMGIAAWAVEEQLGLGFSDSDWDAFMSAFEAGNSIRVYELLAKLSAFPDIPNDSLRL
jgi:hypothetical protein